MAAATIEKTGLQHGGQSSAALVLASVPVGLDTLDTQAGYACHHLTYLSYAYRLPLRPSP